MSEHPPDGTSTALTDWLIELGRSDKRDLDEVVPEVYDALHRLAVQYLNREDVGHTLQPTALVHEAYLRLIDQRRVDWRNKAQFLGVAAGMMRRILVDHARHRVALKRGGSDVQPVSLSLIEAPSGRSEVELIALEQALERLAVMDPRKAKVVELKFYGGLTSEEIGEVLQISDATVEREWSFTRAWLYRAMEGGSS